MIQELLLGVSCSSANFIPTPPDSKFSIINSHNNGLVPPPPPPTTTTTTTSTVASAAAATSSNPENQNLRCPRCDSSNTKFCYYNNYNLTQPRHFCKTCRRYWTKGGALRNVPIGGGCRKNKSAGGSGIGIISSSVAKSSAKIKTVSSSSSPSPGGGGGLDHPHHQEVPAGSPILWGSPQNSQLLALLRASHGQNPNPSPSHSLCLSNPMMSNNNNAMGVSVKEEGSLMVSSHMVGTTEPMGCSNNGSPGFDPTGSFWRSNQDFHQQQHQNMGFVVGEHHQNSSGIQELYQRLRSSCSDDSSSRLFLGNMASSSSSSSPSSSSLAILESGPILGGGLGYWNNNQPLSGWSDLPTTNGASAYP